MKQADATVVPGYRLSSGDAPEDTRFPSWSLLANVTLLLCVATLVRRAYQRDRLMPNPVR
jgi:hypothetical protein